MASAIERILSKLGMPDLVEVLSGSLSGADLTTLLLEVMRRRATGVTPAQVLARYGRDRFTALPAVGDAALRRVEDLARASLPVGYEVLPLAPLVPFGTHAAMGAVDQNRVVSTIRGQEVAADPTNALALEAAQRRLGALRADPKSAARIGLAAAQRVVRAQQVAGPARFAHFSLFGLVTAGRDTGGLDFETAAFAEHVAFHARCALACGAECVTIELSDFTNGAQQRVLAAARMAVASMSAVSVVEKPERARARGYYHGIAMRVDATVGTDTFETSDGGLVDWTQKLVGSAKERCLISGLGIDRLAMLGGSPAR